MKRRDAGRDGPPGDPFGPYDGILERGPEELETWHQTLRHLCHYDPRLLAGQPIGQFHCPECGCMVMAGMAHPKCDPLECWAAEPEVS